jgi:hypothetical protein
MCLEFKGSKIGRRLISYLLKTGRGATRECLTKETGQDSSKMDLARGTHATENCHPLWTAPASLHYTDTASATEDIEGFSKMENGALAKMHQRGSRTKF